MVGLHWISNKGVRLRQVSGLRFRLGTEGKDSVSFLRVREGLLGCTDV